jgi:peptidoglycan/LPS O-acetylase OafA/YrhL
MPASSPARTTGLDTLRAAAIVLVFMYHYMVFVSREPTFGWASEVGWTGVTLFFVLSGYLIANQIFGGIARGQALSLKNFYLRRAFRTLPVFWLVLALFFLFPTAMGGNTPPPLWRFLTFTQNFQLQSGTAFSHAWSLCIEEQFYLVLPAAVLLGARAGGGRRAGWLTLAGLMALGVAARWWLWDAYGTEASGQIQHYYPNVYYGTLCRFGELLPGVAIAALKNFHQPLWQRITRHGQASLALGTVATAVMLWLACTYYYIDNYGYGFFMTAFGYQLVAVAFGVLVVAALSPNSWLHRIRVPGAYRLALWSYSIYLTHKSLGMLLQKTLLPFGLSSWMLVAVVALVSVAAGGLLYRLVETPFMVLRDRWIPGNFARTLGAGEMAAAQSTA